jgi:hypothetical protein
VPRWCSAPLKRTVRRLRTVTLERWRALSLREQLKRVQRLSGDELEELGCDNETVFRATQGGQRGIADVACGEVGHLGPVHGIVVRIKRGSCRVKPPKQFMGFPVFREYQRPDGQWWRSW